MRQLGEQGLQDVVFYRHLIVRHVALGHAIQVAQTNVKCIQTQMPGNISHDAFNHDHALRATKAAKCGMALGVGFQAVRGNCDVLQKVRVVNVKHRPVSHWT